ncbi:partner of sld five [Cryptosporidium ryanae]|uniref:partner of sld five n=1 Tax=Cryptosporidium ryanae TaxID=515981 RepID=UPI00351A60A1|nr:partner of sld five [Cryptosporidium ryanae]
MEGVYTLDAGSDRGLRFEECLFIAEERTMVDIIPNVSMDKRQIFSIEIGPFTPHQRCKVPLWVARYLDSKSLCRLVPPKWLTEEGLKRLVLEEDKIGLSRFSEIDYCYVQIAHIFFQLKNDPFNGKARKVKKLFQDLIGRRQSKLKGNIKQLILPKATDVTNMGLLELTYGSSECFHAINDLQNLWHNSGVDGSQIHSQVASQQHGKDV